MKNIDPTVMKLLIVLLLNIIVSSPLMGEVKTPYVTQIRVAVRGPQVKITWVDSTDTRGTLHVYRNTEEITPETLPKAVLAGIVPYGVESFVDTPDWVGGFFYAVLIRTEAGAIRGELVPFRNKTVTPVWIESIAREEDRAVRITEISTEVQQGQIIVRFAPSRGDREVILYRSTAPILSIDQLSAATEIKRFSSAQTEIIDYPVPGVPYYYAVVDARLMEMSIPVLERGKNATVVHTEVPLPHVGPQDPGILPTFPEITVRSIPLPLYQMRYSFREGKSLPPRLELPLSVPLNLTTEKALRDLVAPLPEALVPTPTPTILDINKAATDQREERLIQGVIQGAFRNRNWKETIHQLEGILTLPISRELRYQVYFYRGQAKFFLAQYREAFFDFLKSSIRFFSESQPWKDSILEQVRLPVSK